MTLSTVARVCGLTFALVLFASACHHGPVWRQGAPNVNSGSMGLRLEWLGTSTVTVSDDKSVIMIDGFVSRPGKLRLGLALLGLPLVSPNRDALLAARTHLGETKIDAIFVAHAHHDHVLDSAQMAQWSRATLYVSQSALVAVNGTTDRRLPAPMTRRVEANETHPVGDFRVTVLNSPHKKTVLGPGGEITGSLQAPTRLRAFRAGPSFAFHVWHPRGSILIVPSAPIGTEKEPVQAMPAANVVLLGIGMLGREPTHTIAQSWHNTVCPDRTSRVYPIHWDDFTRSLSKPLRSFPFDRVGRTMEMLSAFAVISGVEFLALPIASSVTLPVYSPGDLGCVRDDAANGTYRTPGLGVGVPRS